jgi:hypothetical protein
MLALLFVVPSMAWDRTRAKHGFAQSKREHGSRTPKDDQVAGLSPRYAAMRLISRTRNRSTRLSSQFFCKFIQN